MNGGDLAGVVEDTAPEGVDECVHLRVEEVAPATGRQQFDAVLQLVDDNRRHDEIAAVGAQPGDNFGVGLRA